MLFRTAIIQFPMTIYNFILFLIYFLIPPVFVLYYLLYYFLCLPLSYCFLVLYLLFLHISLPHLLP